MFRLKIVTSIAKQGSAYMSKIRLFSWNVNGLRAVLKKQAIQNFLSVENPDFCCFHEVKAKPEQVEKEILNTPLENYQLHWNSAERPGYSGTMTIAKTNLPILSTETNLSEYFKSPDFDQAKSELLENDGFGSPFSEGRVLTLETENFYLVNVYTPNSKTDLSRLKLRHELWDPLFLAYLKHLEKTKPVVVCGDFNAAHQEIDLARPKQNTKNAGFTIEERQGISEILKQDFIDTFRSLNPDSNRYTWWSHWGKARENNIGWRIDYFFISKSLEKNLEAAEIYESILGSDHCPISITLNF